MCCLGLPDLLCRGVSDAMHSDVFAQMSDMWWLQCRLWVIETLCLCTPCNWLRLALMPGGFSQKQLVRNVTAL